MLMVKGKRVTVLNANKLSLVEDPNKVLPC